MSYTVIAVVAVGLMLGVDRWLLRTRLVLRRSFWISYLILVCFQLLSNGVLTGLRVVRYNPDTIIGLRVAFAPVEDLAFGFALILCSLSCWTWLTIGSAANARENGR